MARVALAPLLAACLFTDAALAQTCCTTTGANELGVVERDQSAVLGAEIAHDRAYGTFDASGRFRGLRDAEVDDVVLSLGAGVRLWPRALQVNAALPLRLQYRQLGPSEGTHAGVGDASAALRYLLVEGWRPGSPEGRWVPILEPYAGVRLPTGTGPEDAEDATLVDATGDGAVLAYAGAFVAEYLSHDDVVTLSASYGHRFARDVTTPAGTQSFAPGPELAARAAFAHNIDLFWTWELFLALRATGTAHVDGAAVPDSETHRLRAGATLAHYLRFPTWRLIASAQFDPPIDGLSANVPFAGTSLTLSLRRSFVP